MSKNALIWLLPLIFLGIPHAMAQSYWKAPLAKELPTVRFADPKLFSVVRNEVGIPITQLPPDINQMDQGFCYAHSAAYVTEYWRCKSSKGLCSAMFTTEKLSVLDFTTLGARLLREGGSNIRAFLTMGREGATHVRTRACTYENQMMTTVFGVGPYVYMLNDIGVDILMHRYRARVKNVLLPMLPEPFRNEVGFSLQGNYPRSLEFLRRAWYWNQETNGKYAAELANALVNYYGLPHTQTYAQSALGSESVESYYEALIYNKSCSSDFVAPEYIVKVYRNEWSTEGDSPDYEEELGEDLQGALNVLAERLVDGGLPILAVCLGKCGAANENLHSIVVTGVRQVCQRGGKVCRSEIRAQWHWGNRFQIEANSGWTDAVSLFGDKLERLREIAIVAPGKQ